jgi:hypothetical protein
MDFGRCLYLGPTFLGSKMNTEPLRKTVEHRFLLLLKGIVIEFKIIYFFQYGGAKPQTANTAMGIYSQTSIID